MSVYWILIFCLVGGFLHGISQTKHKTAFPTTTNLFEYIFNTKY